MEIYTLPLFSIIEIKRNIIITLNSSNDLPILNSLFRIALVGAFLTGPHQSIKSIKIELDYKPTP